MVEAQVVGLMKMPVGFVNMCTIDMIARFQGHYANGNRGQSGLAPALADARDSFDAPAPEVEPIPEPEAVFDPPMPPEPQPPPEAAPPSPPPPRMRPDHGVRVVLAKVRLISHCRDTLKSRHPEVYKSLAFAEEATMFFNDALDLLPQDEWPTRQASGKWLWSRNNPENPAMPWVQDVDDRINSYVNGQNHDVS